MADVTDTSGISRSKVAIFAVIAIVCIALLWMLLGNSRTREFLAAMQTLVEENYLLAALTLTLVQTIVVVCILPGLVITLLSGFLFGPVVGTLVLTTGTTLGGCTSFLLGRYCFRKRVESYLESNPRLSALCKSVAHDGWKTVMLTRFIPMFPYKLSNYVFGVLPLRLWEFTLGTALGVIPLSFTYVSIGALAGDLDSLVEGKPEMELWQYTMIGFGIVAAIATFVLVRKRAGTYFDKELPPEVGS